MRRLPALQTCCDRGRPPAMCVILTPPPLWASGTKETTPLWVWLSVALLAIGATRLCRSAVYCSSPIHHVGFFNSAADYVAAASAGRVWRSSRAQTKPSAIMMAAAVSKVGTLPACWMPKP